MSNNVIELATDLIDRSVEYIDKAEPPLNLEEITNVAGIFYSTVVRWAIRDNPNTSPRMIVDYFVDNLKEGLNVLISNKAANDE